MKTPAADSTPLVAMLVPEVTRRALFGLAPLLLPLLAACSSAPSATAEPAEDAGTPSASAGASAQTPPAPPGKADDIMVRICLDSLCTNSCATTPGVAGGSCKANSAGDESCVCDAPTCGGLGEAPCAGNYCSVGHYDSFIQVCATCGGTNQPCCNSVSAPDIPDCYDGTACSDPGTGYGTCKPCGGSGPACPSAVCGLINQAPCPGNVCSEGNYDADWNLCTNNCGGPGQVCCDVANIGGTPRTTECYDGQLCGGNASMDNGSYCAAPCGANDQSPCVGVSPGCQPGTTLLADGLCGACGQGSASPLGCFTLPNVVTTFTPYPMTNPAPCYPDYQPATAGLQPSLPTLSIPSGFVGGNPFYPGQSCNWGTGGAIHAENAGTTAGYAATGFQISSAFPSGYSLPSGATLSLDITTDLSFWYNWMADTGFNVFGGNSIQTGSISIQVYDNTPGQNPENVLVGSAMQYAFNDTLTNGGGGQSGSEQYAWTGGCGPSGSCPTGVPVIGGTSPTSAASVSFASPLQGTFQATVGHDYWVWIVAYTTSNTGSYAVSSGDCYFTSQANLTLCSGQSQDELAVNVSSATYQWVVNQ